MVTVLIFAAVSCREPLPPNTTGTALNASRVHAPPAYELVDLGIAEGGVASFVLLNDHDVVVITTGQGCNQRIRRWENGTWTDPGALGSCGALSTAMNRRGDVVGSSPTPDGSRHAFLWSRGVMRDLGTLGGTESEARALNDRREVVGDALLPDGSHHAFLWSDGRMTDLGTLQGGPTSSATHINPRGEVAGWSDLPERPGVAFARHSFVWTRGVMTDIASFNAGGIRDFSSPGALTRDGSLAGRASVGNSAGDEHGFVWHGGIIAELAPLPNHTVSEALAALDRDWVVGQSRQYPGERPRGVLWRQGAPPQDLGGLTFEALCRVGHPCPQSGEFVRDINAARQIVGRSAPGDPRFRSVGPAHAFVWQDGTMHDLGTLGGDFSDAHAVNKRGTITGVASDAEGRWHVVLWRPAREN